jgi:hypothetical protein
MVIGQQADERHALHAVVVIVDTVVIVTMITTHIRPDQITRQEVVVVAEVAAVVEA